jgi:hypothetical protein
VGPKGAEDLGEDVDYDAHDCIDYYAFVDEFVPLHQLTPLGTGFGDGLNQSPETELQRSPKMVTSRRY